VVHNTLTTLCVKCSDAWIPGVFENNIRFGSFVFKYPGMTDIGVVFLLLRTSRIRRTKPTRVYVRPSFAEGVVCGKEAFEFQKYPIRISFTIHNILIVMIHTRARINRELLKVLWHQERRKSIHTTCRLITSWRRWVSVYIIPMIEFDTCHKRGDIISTSRIPCLCPSIRQRRQNPRRQKRNDGNHHHELDECKSSYCIHVTTIPHPRQNKKRSCAFCSICMLLLQH